MGSRLSLTTSHTSLYGHRCPYAAVVEGPQPDGPLHFNHRGERVVGRTHARTLWRHHLLLSDGGEATFCRSLHSFLLSPARDFTIADPSSLPPPPLLPLISLPLAVTVQSLGSRPPLFFHPRHPMSTATIRSSGDFSRRARSNTSAASNFSVSIFLSKTFNTLPTRNLLSLHHTAAQPPTGAHQIEVGQCHQ